MEPKYFPCNKDATFFLNEARKRFQNQDLSEEVLHCYCGVRSFLIYFLDKEHGYEYLDVLENLPDDSNGSCEKFQNALEDKRKEDFVE